MVWPFRRNNRSQADEGAEPPGSPDEAVDPQAAPADDSDGSDRGPEGAHAGPPVEFGDEGPLGRHEAKKMGRHAAGGGDNVDSATGQDDMNRPADRGDQEREVIGSGRVVFGEPIVVEVPPGMDPEEAVRAARESLSQAFREQ